MIIVHLESRHEDSRRCHIKVSSRRPDSAEISQGLLSKINPIPKTTVFGTCKNRNEDTAVKAALYMRVSKSDGSQTVENQRRDLLAYAERMGYQVVEFVDTETGSRSDR